MIHQKQSERLNGNMVGYPIKIIEISGFSTFSKISLSMTVKNTKALFFRFQLAYE